VRQSRAKIRCSGPARAPPHQPHTNPTHLAGGAPAVRWRPRSTWVVRELASALRAVHPGRAHAAAPGRARPVLPPPKQDSRAEPGHPLARAGGGPLAVRRRARQEAQPHRLPLFQGARHVNWQGGRRPRPEGGADRPAAPAGGRRASRARRRPCSALAPGPPGRCCPRLLPSSAPLDAAARAARPASQLPPPQPLPLPTAWPPPRRPSPLCTPSSTCCRSSCTGAGRWQRQRWTWRLPYRSWPAPWRCPRCRAC
jgi:hypothetical protein